MPRGRQRTQIARIEAEAQEANSGDATSQETETAYKNAIAAREKAEEELTKAEENVKAAEQKVSELEEGATSIEATSSDEESITEEKKELTFGDVKAEDVKVYYEVLTNRDEVNADESGEVQPNYEEREAQIGSLGNNDGSFTLSFTDPDAATNATDFYIVVIDAMGLSAPVYVDITQPILTTESSVKSDSESCDVTIQAQDATFATNLGAGDLTLGGSFEGMSVTSAEAAGNTLTVHLSGTPTMNYEEASTYMDGQITVPASGFENSTSNATAYVNIALPEEAFDVGDAEVLDPVSAMGYVDYVSFDGDTAKATVYLYADLGIFNDVKPESIALDECFTGGKVESVSKENESDFLLKVEVSFPAKGVDEDNYIESAWAVVSTYYNANDPQNNGKYQPDANNVCVALEQIDARPAGTNPDDVRKANQAGKDIKVYSPSLGFSIKRSRIAKGGLEVGLTSNESCSDDKIMEYSKRLQGGLYDDLVLAGLEVGDESTQFDGIGFRVHVDRKPNLVKTGFQRYSRATYDSLEIWTFILFKDKSMSPKKTYKGSISYKDTKNVKGESWYTFYWFDRA